jgi:hypothetical protein
MRKLVCILVASLGLFVAACGGDAGGSSNASQTSSGSLTNNGNDDPANGVSPASGVIPASAPVATTPNADASATPVASTTANTAPISISAAPFGVPNFPMTTVTICAPGTTNCMSINNVLVDTGSYGLRLFNSVIPTATLAALPVQTQTVGSKQIAECAEFGTGFTWGTVRAADIKISGELASGVPIQVIGDSSASVPSAAPSACVINAQMSTPGDLGANGILGIGVAPTDCAGCASFADDEFYYACSSGSCAPTTEQGPLQVANPVAHFQSDNNGVIVELAQVADAGAMSSAGTLVFGIDTQPNNALVGSTATVFTTDQNGDFNTTYKGATNAESFFDSGSNGLFFRDSSIPQAADGFYAPTSTLPLSVAITGANQASATVPFNIANSATLFTNGNEAFNDLGFSQAGGFDFGIPFFFGRHVYYGIGGKSSSGGTGPYVAYVSQ